jgi:hypothetical protein
MGQRILVTNEEKPADWVIKHNLDATSPPTADDDSTKQYSRGSMWIGPWDGEGSLAYAICLDNSAGDAKWYMVADIGTVLT